MKSISAVAENLIEGLALSGGAMSLPALQARAAPLGVGDIAKLDDAIEKHLTVTRRGRYGYVPVCGDDGQLIRQEFDVIGEDIEYQPKGDTPRSLIDAMTRPAKREHIVYHLGRLAAHRRDSRGREALEVVLQDIASDMCGVSEYAVVLACTEMRRKNSTWFPNSGEIMEIIKRYNQKLADLAESSYGPAIADNAAKAITADPRLGMSFRELPKKSWLPVHWRWYVEDAEHMAQLSRDQGRITQADQWRAIYEQRLRERDEAKIAA